MVYYPNGSTFHLAESITRLSSRKGEHGHRQWARLDERQRQALVVKVDGKVINCCISVDAKAGWVDFGARRNDQYIINKFKDAVVIHRLYGRVEIAFSSAEEA
ncbi:hypothetical protein LJR159_000947 [Pseudomonas brassicacearum]|uniref:hypothetical protein n=1 Tax=Pseudomonas brassicacearum TaxID=930166 RepID=UPI003ECE6D74